MEASDTIKKLIEIIDFVETQGNYEADFDGLRNEVNSLEIELKKELQKFEHEANLTNFTIANQSNLEMFKAVLDAGKSAIHALLIINGGAVIALLGTFSSLIGKPNSQELATYLALPLSQFGIGVLIAAAAFAVRYLSQEFYSKSESISDKNFKIASVFKIIAVGACIAGYILFGIAIANTYHGILWSFDV